MLSWADLINVYVELKKLMFMYNWKTDVYVELIKLIYI